MVRRSIERVYGPYEHRPGTWRVVFVDGRGGRSTESFAGEGAEARARAAIAKLEAKLKGFTVSAAIAEYVGELGGRELRATSIASTGHRLRTFFGVDEVLTGGLVEDLTKARARQLLEATSTRDVEVLVRGGHQRRKVVGRRQVERPRSVTYRSGMLAEAGTFARWLVERGYLRADKSGTPLAGLEVKGRRRRGKAQLRIDEARSFAGHCLEAAAGGDLAALAAALCLLLGCRASEVTDRLARDVDDGARVLWIPDAKTDAGRRRLEVPDVVRELLAGALVVQVDGQPRRRAPADRIFPADRHWLLHHVRRLCGAAKVPVICTQSLRGLHSTLATEAGVTAHAIASSLGHTSTIMQQRHYTAPATTERAKQGRAFKVLAGGRS